MQQDTFLVKGLFVSPFGQSSGTHSSETCLTNPIRSRHCVPVIFASIKISKKNWEHIQ